jgi:AcrR family transcriptional regulator
VPPSPATRRTRTTRRAEEEVTEAADAATRRAGGRSLDATRDVDIRAAVLELLAEVGYDQVTMEAVAARARAGKGTIYRRWPSKADLVVDAINDLKPPPVDLPDTGSLPGDIRALFDGVALSGPDDAFPLIAGLAAPLVRDPELAAAFREHFVAPRVARLQVMLDRAVGRGEIAPHPDADLLCAVFPAFMLHRTVIEGEPPDPAFVRRIVEDVLIPLATATKPATPEKGAR